MQPSAWPAGLCEPTSPVRQPGESAGVWVRGRDRQLAFLCRTGDKWRMRILSLGGVCVAGVCACGPCVHDGWWARWPGLCTVQMCRSPGGWRLPARAGVPGLLGVLCPGSQSPRGRLTSVCERQLFPVLGTHASLCRAQ